MALVETTAVIPGPINAVWDVFRDFNGHDRWHPAVAESEIEAGQPADKVGCVRRFRLSGGEELREQLLALSDAETMFRYCLIETPLPLFNYVASVRLIPVTQTNDTFVQWSARFQTPRDEAATLKALVRDGVQRAGIAAVAREVLGHAD